MPLSPQHVDGCARLGIARLKAFRLNVYESILGGNIDLIPVGGAPGLGFEIEGAAIQHALNDQTDTASLRVRGVNALAGQLVTVTNGDQDTTHRLFRGRILETTVGYESLAINPTRDLRCVDSTWLMQRRKVLATYVNQSASVIATDLLTRFCRGITGGQIAPNLPILDTITFTNEALPQCLTAICERIGGSWFVDFNDDLHLFLTESEQAAPITDATPRGARDLALAEDLSQVATRIIGRGGGVGAAIDVAAGATEIPVDEGDAVSWYSALGGLVETGTQVLSYTGVKGRGGVGALVGTGNTPTSPVAVTLASGTALGSGVYKYAITFATATGGETTPGPVTAITTGGSAPTLTQVAVRSTGVNHAPFSGMVNGGRYAWRVHLVYEGGSFAIGPPTPTYTVDGNIWEIGLGPATVDPVTGFSYYPSLTTSGIARIVQVVISRTTNGGVQFYTEKGFAGGTTSQTGWYETANGFTDGNIVTNPPYPTGPIAQFNAAKVLQPISAPPTGFTKTNLYRTAVNSPQLRLLVTNIPTGADYYDATADAALGASAPAVDTSGVVASAGLIVPAGATELLVTSTVPFTNDGGAGWARIGDLVIRYTGIAGSALTGIPSAGPGALTATVRYGAQVLVQPRLIGVRAAGGIGAVVQAIRKGDTIALRVELEDAAAIAAMAERLKTPGQAAVTADGIIEEFVSDGRFGLIELTTHCQATLLEHKDPSRTLTFTSRDDSLQVGRLLQVTISTPPIAGTFRIQRVTFSEIAITGGLGRVRPLRTVEATTKLFTFTNLLRQLRGREGGVP
jgi:hypothetical protein